MGFEEGCFSRLPTSLYLECYELSQPIYGRLRSLVPRHGSSTYGIAPIEGLPPQSDLAVADVVLDLSQKRQSVVGHFACSCHGREDGREGLSHPKLEQAKSEGEATIQAQQRNVTRYNRRPPRTTPPLKEPTLHSSSLVVGTRSTSLSICRKHQIGRENISAWKV